MDSGQPSRTSPFSLARPSAAKLARPFARFVASRALLWVVFVLLVLLASSAEACPTCKNGLASNDNAEGIIAGYFWSILFMMAMPFVMFGSFCGYMYVLVRRERSRRSATELAESEQASGAAQSGLTSEGKLPAGKPRPFATLSRETLTSTS